MIKLEKIVEDENSDWIKALDPEALFESSSLRQIIKAVDSSFKSAIDNLIINSHASDDEKFNYVDAYCRELSSYMIQLSRVSSNIQASMEKIDSASMAKKEKDGFSAFIYSYKKIAAIIRNTIQTDMESIKNFVGFVHDYKDIAGSSQKIGDKLKEIQLTIRNDLRRIYSDKGALKRLYAGILMADYETPFDLQSTVVGETSRLQEEITTNCNNTDGMLKVLTKTHGSLSAMVLSGIEPPYKKIADRLEEYASNQEKIIEKKAADASAIMERIMKGDENA